MAMVQAVSYNFGTVENPLSDGGNFTIISDVDFIGSLRAVAGNKCEPTATASSGGALWSAAIAAPSGTWPADQYSEITLTTWATAGDLSYLVVRQGAFNSGTQYIVQLSFSNQNIVFFAVVAGTAHTLATDSQASAQGDVFRLAVVGNVLTLSRNGTAVQTFTDTNNYVTSGSPGFGLYSPVAGIASAQTSLWAAGANQSSTPTFSPNGGSFGPAQTVTITSASGGTIYYTTDGSTPTESSSSIASGSTVSISTSCTLKAIASVANNLDSTVASAVFTINGACGTPTFSPVAGAYSTAQTVTISSTTAGASIYYTTDGSTPTSGSTPYTTPVSIASTSTLKAIAEKTNFSNSAIGSAAYTIGGNVYDSTKPFIGSMSETSDDSQGTQYIGHVIVIGSAPAGLANPYLGKIKKVVSAPAGVGDPLLGQVVIVVSAPPGDPDPYLGHVNET